MWTDAASTVRQISAMAGVLPRGCMAPVCSSADSPRCSPPQRWAPQRAQEMDDLHPNTEKLYLHHYGFPPYSVGETRPMRSRSS